MEMIQFDEHIFQQGWFNHQLDQFCMIKIPILKSQRVDGFSGHINRYLFLDLKNATNGQKLHVWYIFLHLGSLGGKCR